MGTRRANPIVSMSGSSTRENHGGAAAPGFWSLHAAARRRRASSTSCSRMRRLTPQNSPSVRAPLAQSACSVSAVPSVDSARPSSAGSVQVGACTPFVIDVIGTSSASKPGQRSPNIRRLTSPCSFETPLARCASRRPITAMLNALVAGSRAGLGAEGEHVGRVDAREQRAGEVALDEGAVEPVDARGNRRVGGEHRAGAHHLERLGEREALGDVRRDALEPEEPGVALVDVEDVGRGAAAELGEGAHRAGAADAEQELLQQAVLAAAAVEAVGDGSRSSSSFSGMSVSSSSSVMRPTAACQTRACSDSSSGSASVTCTGEPSGRRSTESGRPSGSSTG